MRGDLLEDLPALVEQVPPEATLVVFHSAVLVYLSGADRSRFAETMSRVRGHWVCNEGSEVMPVKPPSPLPATSAVAPASFVLALDGSPVAWTHGHGRAVRWL